MTNKQAVKQLSFTKEELTELLLSLREASETLTVKCQDEQFLQELLAEDSSRPILTRVPWMLLERKLQDAIAEFSGNPSPKPVKREPKVVEPVVCGFDVAWVGKCKNARANGKTVCEVHTKERCMKCGEQATRQCDETIGPMVCGYTTCDKCNHTHSRY